MKTFTAHIPADLAEQVDAASARLERSRGWIIKQALEEWIANHPHRPTGFSEAPMQFTHTTKTAAEALATLKTLRETTTLGAVSWQELRDAGRK